MTVTIYEEVASELTPFVRNFHRKCSRHTDVYEAPFYYVQPYLLGEDLSKWKIRGTTPLRILCILLRKLENYHRENIWASRHTFFMQIFPYSRFISTFS